jgi:hypothetical protein
MTASQSAVWAPRAVERCMEFVTPARHAGDLARAAPGTALQSSFAQIALKFAPGRWLLIEPDQSWLANLTPSEGYAFEVTGKWQLFTADVSEAQASLAAATDIEALLHNRCCARTYLFDCPAVIAQLGQVFLACIEASYVAAWRSSIASTMQP